MFIFNLCQEMDMEKKDVCAMFQELRMLYGNTYHTNPELIGEVEHLFEDTTIRRLDIKRMYRYLDKNIKIETVQEELEDE